MGVLLTLLWPVGCELLEVLILCPLTLLWPVGCELFEVLVLCGLAVEAD